MWDCIYGFIGTYLSEGKDIDKYIQPIILGIIEERPDFVFETVCAFTEACLSQDTDISLDIKKAIEKL